MKFFHKPKPNDSFCIKIKLNFQKTGKVLIPRKSYRKQKYNPTFLNFQNCDSGCYVSTAGKSISNNLLFKNVTEI